MLFFNSPSFEKSNSKDEHKVSNFFRIKTTIVLTKNFGGLEFIFYFCTVILLNLKPKYKNGNIRRIKSALGGCGERL